MPPRPRNADEFANRGYTPKNYPHGQVPSRAQRAADLLKAAADHFPRGFIDKRNVVKAIDGLAKAPGVNDKSVKNLGSTLQSAERILLEEHDKGIVYDRVDGVRATVDDADLTETKQRLKLRRLKGAANGYKVVVDHINRTKLPKDLKSEMDINSNNMDKILGNLNNMKALPPAKKDS